MKFQLDLSNYVTKAGLKNATGVDASKLPSITNLATTTSLTVD